MPIRTPLRIIGIIPARYASTRLPGKPLADIQGKSLIEHVWRQAREAKRLSRLIVATDDQRIAKVVQNFGGEAVMTPRNCASGTDRLAIVARKLPCDVVVNIQGDEPFLVPATLDQLVEPFYHDRGLKMATLAAPLPAGDLRNPHAVKVVCDQAGYALYFSRAPIPFPHDGITSSLKKHLKLHLGMYAYSRNFLLEFAAWPQTALEKIEHLEQLRALEHGIKIRVVAASRPTLSVDTPADLERARKKMARK